MKLSNRHEDGSSIKLSFYIDGMKHVYKEIIIKTKTKTTTKVILVFGLQR